MLVEVKSTEISSAEQVESLEAHMLNMEQVDCPVAHHFGPGIYVREVTLPAGIIAVGHAQRLKHLNIMLTGKVAIIENDVVRVLEAPMIFVGEPGRKIGYIIETCVWQNIYTTSETDIDVLESHFLDKSETWLNHEMVESELRRALHQIDRDDFYEMLRETDFSIEVVRTQSENKTDQIPMPDDWCAVTSIRESDIEGKGLFLSWSVNNGMIIAPARINGKRTPAGRYVNHSKHPNCKFVKIDGDICLIATRDIAGCQGGSKGEELTVDYRQALSLSGIGDKTCQV